MAIDLPASSQISPRGNQNPVNQLMNQRQETLQVALKALNIKAGETIDAVVKAVHQVDPQLRSRLIHFIQPTNDTASTGPLRNATTQQSIQQLLQSPKLTLAEVEVRGQTLLVFGEHPLKPQQGLSLQLRHGQFLTYTPTAGVSSSPSENRQTTLTSTQRQILIEALRHLLPQMHSPRTQGSTNPAAAYPASRPEPTLSETLNQIQLFRQWLQAPENTQLKAAVPASLQNSLRNLAAQIRSPDQLSQPKQLKSALLNSGALLEHKLAQSVSTMGSATHSAAFGNDLKAVLLKVMQQLNPGPADAVSADPTPMNLAPLLKHWRGERTTNQSGSGTEQWLRLLQAAIAKSLNRLQYCQLQSLQQTLDTPGQPMNLEVEIPIRYGHDLQQMSLQLQEDWVTHYPDTPQTAPEKIRQWRVKLAFELPDAGGFHAHLIVTGTAVSASLWAEKHTTFSATQASLAKLRTKLEQGGCLIRQLECFQGRPPEQANRLNYSLVDITT